MDWVPTFGGNMFGWVPTWVLIATVLVMGSVIGVLVLAVKEMIEDEEKKLPPLR